MKLCKHSRLRVLFILLLSFVIIVAACSPSLHHDTSIELRQEHSSFNLYHAAISFVGVKNVIALNSLLPAPHFHYLFIVASLLLLVGVTRFLMLLYPSIYLLRKQELLRPIKFTSIFVGLSIKS